MGSKNPGCTLFRLGRAVKYVCKDTPTTKIAAFFDSNNTFVRCAFPSPEVIIVLVTGTAAALYRSHRIPGPINQPQEE
jgi:hypothetical protein